MPSGPPGPHWPTTRPCRTVAPMRFRRPSTGLMPRSMKARACSRPASRESPSAPSRPSPEHGPGAAASTARRGGPGLRRAIRRPGREGAEGKCRSGRPRPPDAPGGAGQARRHPLGRPDRRHWRLSSAPRSRGRATRRTTDRNAQQSLLRTDAWRRSRRPRRAPHPNSPRDCRSPLRKARPGPRRETGAGRPQPKRALQFAGWAGVQGGVKAASTPPIAKSTHDTAGANGAFADSTVRSESDIAAGRRPSAPADASGAASTLLLGPAAPALPVGIAGGNSPGPTGTAGTLPQAKAAQPTAGVTGTPLPQSRAAASATARKTGTSPPTDEADARAAPAAAKAATAETSLAPAATITPTPADQVLAALSTLGIGPAAADRSPVASGPAAAATPQPASDGGTAGNPTPLRTLTINLNPDHLGPVSITLRMTAGVMDIKIAVASHEALQLLERDRHAITAAVEAAGLKSDRVALTGVSAATAHAASDPSSTLPQSTAQRGPDAFTSSPSPEGRHPRQEPPSGSSAQPKTDTDDDAPPHSPSHRRSLDGSLYV